MLRLQFTKTGTAVWISHLDLMRVLQRAFRRAGLLLKHSQGFTPHPCLSIALPLSVGVASDCELADVELEQEINPETLPDRLNAVLPEGIRILKCYTGGRKIKELSKLEAELRLEYDNGVPAGAAANITALFRRRELLVEKKGKSGSTQLDVIPLLYDCRISQADANSLLLHSVVAAQNPTLNPLLLISAIRAELKQDAPDFAVCHRVALYDAQGKSFT